MAEGAACSAVLVEHASQAALLPPMAALAVVVITMLRQHTREQRTEAVPEHAAGSLESDSTFG
jgi:uncharacterized membrane protein YoaK (UPF0700 family)